MKKDTKLLLLAVEELNTILMNILLKILNS